MDAFAERLCCSCAELKKTVRNFLCVPALGPSPGKGWGCVVCDIPANGAVAILCDDCIAQGDPPIQFIIEGSAFEGKLIPWLPDQAIPFDHDLSKHPPEDERELWRQ